MNSPVGTGNDDTPLHVRRELTGTLGGSGTGIKSLRPGLKAPSDRGRTGTLCPIVRFRCTHSSSLCAPNCAWCDWMSANSWPIRFHYRKLGKSTTTESTVQLGSMYVGRRTNRLREENIHFFFIYKTLWFDSYWKKIFALLYASTIYSYLFFLQKDITCL